MAGNVAGFFFSSNFNSLQECVCSEHSLSQGPTFLYSPQKKSRARAGLSGMEEGMPQTTLHLDRASCAQEAESRA